MVPGTRVCNLPAWKSIWKGRSERSLPTRSLGKVRMVARGGGAAASRCYHPMCSSTRESCSFPAFLFQELLRPLPLPAFLVLPAQGTGKVPTGAAHSGLRVLMGLKLQGAVAQWRFRCCDPLPGLCARQAAGGTGRRRQPSPCWPGEPRTRPCTEAGFARQAWDQNCVVASQPHRGDVGSALPVAF